MSVFFAVSMVAFCLSPLWVPLVAIVAFKRLEVTDDE